MSLTPNSGSIISVTDARNLISTFNNKFPGETISSFIGLNNVNRVLNQPNCIGIRIYNGYDDVNKKLCLVIIGVDNQERDIVASGIIYDDLLTCPTICPINGLYP